MTPSRQPSPSPAMSEHGWRPLVNPERVLSRGIGGGCLLDVAARMPGLTLTETETFASEFQNMTGMGEPVKQRAQEPGILKDLCPLAERQVGRNQQGAPTIALTKKAKQQLCALRREGDKAQFVDDNQLLLEQCVLEAIKLLGGLGLNQVRNQGGCGEEAYGIAEVAGGITKGRGEMRFNASIDMPP